VGTPQVEDANLVLLAKWGKDLTKKNNLVGMMRVSCGKLDEHFSNYFRLKFYCAWHRKVCGKILCAGPFQVIDEL